MQFEKHWNKLNGSLMILFWMVLQGPMGLRGEPGRAGDIGKPGSMVRSTHS